MSVMVDRKALFDPGWSRGVDVIKWSWATGAGETSAYGGQVPNISGRIMGIKAVPSADSPPDDGYDVILLDKENGMDVLNGAGLDLPQAGSAAGNIRVPVDFKAGANVPLVNEFLTFSGVNLGESTAGVFYLWVAQP